MTLHILSCAPESGPALSQCLNALAEGDALLLLADGVYAALDGSIHAQALNALVAGIEIHALSDDCLARGLNDRLLARVVPADYARFVALAAQHPRSVSWY